jgi:hypothetical protein
LYLVYYEIDLVLLIYSPKWLVKPNVGIIS